MTNVSKSSMFGPSAVFDQATYEPRFGKTFWMAATDITACLRRCAFDPGCRF